MRSQPASNYRQRIIDAAIRCFDRFGVQRATLTDVADEAGLSRKTVYRVFDDRTALLVAILTQRFEPMVIAMSDRIAALETLQDALVEGPLTVLDRLRQDELLLDIIGKMSDRGIEDRLLGNNAAARDMLSAVWRPVFDRARKRGELSGNRDDERLIEGIRIFCGLLGLQVNMSAREQRQFLKDFLVPAILLKEAK